MMFDIYTYTQWVCSLYKEGLKGKEVDVFLLTSRTMGDDGMIARAYQNNGYGWNCPKIVNRSLNKGRHVIVYIKDEIVLLEKWMVWHGVGHLIKHRMRHGTAKGEIAANEWVIEEASKRGYFKIIRGLKKYNDEWIDDGVPDKEKRCYYKAALNVNKLLKDLKLDKV